MRTVRCVLISAALLFSAFSASLTAADDAPPNVGDAAPDFVLPDLDGTNVKLSETTKSGPTVLVVLRGYPGYQCPICTRQVGDLIKHAGDFEKAGATVLLVYPGPKQELALRGKEFLKGTRLPKNFHLLIDAGYSFTNKYHLRWDQPRETAYPSTFVVNTKGKITYALISKTHGGRAKTEDVLNAVTAAR